ncbi:tetratricopeptide repeat protein [Aliiruegeria haliotis]|uniref:Tetratricopeptide repeat protein n=1 Tax=Aliiruegeria haliotis TaxID=1280846 RepID=A0A2T0RWD2_9RHOB|nr:hypothetical protein [Aliiruegeria haliotis]PRY25468.1 tetratricopeptide repeat protein [Aliiruegeria haliotis]
MIRIASIVALATIASGAMAETCPPADPDLDRRDEILRRVQQAPDARSGQILANELWEIWAEAPDAHAQELLDEGIDRRAAFDLANAEAAFEALIAYCPDYAEGYNQRAFVLFIRQDFALALEDLHRALDRSPEHLGALTGRAMTYMALGRNRDALTDLEAALTMNPWLKERDLVPVLRHRLGEQDL